jgi:hypothetical protein
MPRFLLFLFVKLVMSKEFDSFCQNPLFEITPIFFKINIPLFFDKMSKNSIFHQYFKLHLRRFWQ